jgi:hypothetical protein
MVAAEAIIVAIKARKIKFAPLGGKPKMGGSHETYVLREC